jgi:hypothetical protein
LSNFVTQTPPNFASGQAVLTQKAPQPYVRILENRVGYPGGLNDAIVSDDGRTWKGERRSTAARRGITVKQNPGVAAALSFVFPGLGQVYALELDKGILIGIAWAATSIWNGFATSKALVEHQYLVARLDVVDFNVFRWTILASIVMVSLWIYAICDARDACRRTAEDEERTTPRACVATPETAATSQDQPGK